MDFVYLLQNIVVEGVVAGHSHQGAKTNPDGVEDLSCSIHPHLQYMWIFLQNSSSLSAPVINSHSTMNPN